MTNIEYLNRRIHELSLSEETSLMNILIGAISNDIDSKIWKEKVDQHIEEIKAWRGLEGIKG